MNRTKKSVLTRTTQSYRNAGRNARTAPVGHKRSGEWRRGGGYHNIPYGPLGSGSLVQRLAKSIARHAGRENWL